MQMAAATISSVVLRMRITKQMNRRCIPLGEMLEDTLRLGRRIRRIEDVRKCGVSTQARCNGGF